VSDDADNGVDELTPGDRELLSALAEAWGDDPLPDGIIERAEALLTWAGVDEELAELLESASTEPAGTRGAGGASAPAAVEFQVGDGSVVIEVSLGAAAVEGQVLGVAATEVVLERPTGDAGSSPVDDLGRFSIADPGAGPVRLRVVTGSANEVRTDWFAI
jgi:hypothetical protein